jgi:hypothetical protein
MNVVVHFGETPNCNFRDSIEAERKERGANGESERQKDAVFGLLRFRIKSER